MAKHSPEIHDQPLQEEDYIDMDLSSTAAAEAATTTAGLFCYNSAMATSPQHSREFEFHMSAPPDLWEPVASPADELFYKGKLLPLHLPPRIQMVEKLLESAAENLLSVSTAPATPYQSCNVSAAIPCYASGELNAEYYFHECISAGSDAAEEAVACEKKPWSKKLKFIRHLNLGFKLKASKAYLKTIFATKGGNTYDKNGVPRANELSNTQFTTWRKNPFGHIRSKRYIASPVSTSTTVGGKFKEDECGHRRSFSSVIIRYSSSNKTSSVSSSSCSSSNSSSFSMPSSNDSGVEPVLRRSSSACSEMDNPIQGAIAYCKKSQQLALVRKSASDAGFRFMSSSASKIAAESEETEGIFEITRNRNVNSMSLNHSVPF